MVHFLRDNLNKSIIEVSVNSSKGDLSASVYITHYSNNLLGIRDDGDPSKVTEFINTVEQLSEIRGWWWEKERMFGKWDSIDDFVGWAMQDAGKKLGLVYVTD